MNPTYASRYRTLYQTHWWWRAREQHIRAALEAHRPAPPWGRILDVGCGDGLFFDYLGARGTVEGIETDPTLVDPSGRYAGQIHVRPFDRTFDPPHRYDIVLMLDVLEHLDDPIAALALARRLLHPDGLLLVTVPALQALWTHHDVLNQHRRRYRRAELTAHLESAGFVPSQVEYFFCWTVLGKLALRAKESMLGPSLAASDLPGAVPNRLLYALSRSEAAVLRRVSMPFGSSLLAVATPRRDH